MSTAMLAPLAHLQNEAALAPEDLERQAKVAQGLSTLAAEPVRRTPMVEQGALGTLMRMMGDHADAPSVQVPGCTALWYLASERDCRRDIAAAGAIQRVLAVMTAPRYAGNAALQTAGCSFLWVMSDEAGAHRSRLLAGGAVAAVLAVLRAHGVRAAEAAWPALGFLWNVSQDASTRPDIAAGDGIELGMSSAAAHVRNQDVVLAGCGFLWNMTDEARWRAVIADRGPGLLCDIMRAHPKLLSAPHNFKQCAAVQIHALGALVNVTIDGSVRPKVMACGVVGAIVIAMDAYKDHPDIQLQACAVLANLTIDDASLEEIMAAGCAPRVLTAMTTHPSSARVQQDAAGVLSNITLREVHRAVVASWGAVKVVLTSLTTHIDDVEVLWRGVGVLLNLSLSFSLRPGILAEGTVPIVLKCQLAFESDERLQWRALGTLLNFTMKSDQERMRLEIIACGTVRVTLKIMAVHLRSVECQLRAVGVLFNLTGDDCYRWVVQSRSGAVGQVLEAMRTHDGAPDVIWNAAGALCNMSGDAAGRVRMAELGAAPLLLAALRAHGGCHDVARNACGALRNVSSDVPARPGLLGGDAVVIAGEVLKLHSGSVEVVRNVAGLAWYLSEEPAGRTAIGESDCLPALISSMDVHCGDADVQMRVLACAAHLAADPVTRPVLVSHGARFMSLVASAMRRHVHAVDVVWRAGAVLASMGRDGRETRARIVAAGCMELVMRGMVEYPLSIMVQSHMVTALAHICLDVDARVAAMESVPMILAAMRSMLFHLHTAKYACAAIYQLVTEAPARGMILDKGLIPPLVELMRAHVRDNAVAWRACGVLETITRDPEWRGSVPQECVECVVAFMLAHRALAAVQWRCCGTLFHISDDGTRRAPILGANALAPVVTAMREHAGDVEVLVRAAGFVSNSTIESAAHQHILAAGTCRPLLSAMQTHVDDRGIAFHGAAALARLTFPPPQRPEIVTERAVPIVLESMRTHALDSDIQRDCTVCLANIAEDPGPLTRGAELACGVPSAVVSAMAAHKGVCDLQRAACRVLRWLAADAGEPRASVAGCGAPFRLLEALRMHPDDEPLAWNACGAVWNLARDMPFALALRDLGAVRTVIDALGAHIPSAETAWRAGGALWLLVADATSRRQALDGGAADVLSRGMAAHARDAPTAHSSTWALSNLVLEPVDGPSLVHASGAAPYVISAMGIHTASLTAEEQAEIVLRGAYVMMHICSWSAEGRAGIVAAGGIPRILFAMGTDGGPVELARASTHVLEDLTSDAPHVREVVGKGAVSKLVGAMREHLKDDVVQMHAAGAIANIVRSSDGIYVMAALGRGALLAVLQAMKSHPGVLAIQVLCAAALAAIATVADARPTVMSNGAAAPLLSAMRRHGSDLSLVSEALSCFSSLTLDAVARPPLLLAGVHLVTLAALDDHTLLAVVNQRACSVLANLSSDDPAMRPLLENRTIPRLVAAMSAHRVEPEVQVLSCITLEALCAWGGAAREQAEAERVCECVVLAADVHLSHLSVQLAGARVIFQLCANAPVRPNLLARGAGRIVTAGMAVHGSSAPLALVGCDIMGYFAEDNAAECLLLCAPGSAAKVLLDALAIHVAVESISWKALHGLFFFSRAASGGPAEEGTTPRTSLVRGDAVPRVIAALTTHPSSEDVAWRGTGVLHALAAPPDEHRVRILECGGLVVLVKVIRNHMPSFRAQEHALGCVSHLVYDPVVCADALAAGVVQSVVQSLRIHWTVAAVVVGGIELLRCMARTEEGRSEVIGKGGTEQLLLSLEVHPDIRDVQLAAVEAANALALNEMPAESKQVAKRGLAAAVVARMAEKANAASPDVQLCGAGALWALTRAHAAKDLGVVTEAKRGEEAKIIIPRVCIAMVQHARQGEIVRYSAAVLENLGALGWNRPIIMGKTVAKGALPLLVDAMKLHAKLVATVLRAIKAMRNLATDPGPAREILNAGVMQLVGNAMTTHRESLATQIAACELSQRMTSARCDTDGDAAATTTKHTVQAIVAGMAAYGESQELLSVGLRVLWHCATGERNRDPIIVKGAIPVILSALGTHEMHEDIQHFGLATLALLSSSADGRRGIVVDTALRLVLAAIARHPQHRGVQVEGCTCARWFTEDARNRGMAAAAGTVGVVCGAMDRAPSDDIDVCSQSMFALGNLCLEASALPLAQEQGAVAIAPRCMMAHASAAVVQTAGLQLMASLASNSVEMREALAAAGAIGAMTAAVTAHASNLSVYQQAVRVLARMSVDEVHREACATFVPAVVAGMAAAKEDATALGCVIAFLNQLVLEARFRIVVAGAGGAQALISAMQPHLTVVEILRGACSAVTALLRDDATSVSTRGVVARADNMIIITSAGAIVSEQVRILQAALEAVMVAPTSVSVATQSKTKKK